MDNTTPPADSVSSDLTRPTLGLRHLVLWVSDPKRSAEFYSQALGLVVQDGATDRAVFMSSPGSGTDHDLGLFRAQHPTPVTPGALGMYHVSWEIGTLAELKATKARLSSMGALVGENNHGVSRSLYCKDPDGNEFEVMWEVPLDLVADDEPSGIPLDFDSDFERFGADLPGRGAR